jgi:hypothetical protein
MNDRKMSATAIDGTEIQTIKNGRRNLTRKTDVKMPIIRNLRRHNVLIVLRMLAFTIALSTLLTISKTIKPMTIATDSMIDKGKHTNH